MPANKKMKKEELYNLCKEYEQEILSIQMTNNIKDDEIIKLTELRDTLQQELVKTIDRKNHFKSEYMRVKHEFNELSKVSIDCSNSTKKGIMELQVDMNSCHRVLQEENKKLKEANKTLKTKITEFKEKNDEFSIGVIELQKEKMENQEYTVECEREIEKLQEANKTLGDTIKSYQEGEQNSHSEYKELNDTYENAIAELGNRETELSNIKKEFVVVLNSLKANIDRDLSKYN